MIKKYILNLFHTPKLCSKINTNKYPWGWKSQDEVNKIISYPIKDHSINYINYEKKFIHEYKLREFCEEMYYKTYYAYANEFDFLNSNLYSPKLSIGINYLRSNLDQININEEIKVIKVEMLNSWIKYGSIRNPDKFLGYYNNHEITHEISAGIIGPEVRSIWDQNSIKQKVRFLIELNTRKDVFDFERDLMITNNNWQLCNINRIIL